MVYGFSVSVGWGAFFILRDYNREVKLWLNIDQYTGTCKPKAL